MAISGSILVSQTEYRLKEIGSTENNYICPHLIVTESWQTIIWKISTRNTKPGRLPALERGIQRRHFIKQEESSSPGGAEGIGKAIVRAFRGAGHRVAFCDKNETLGKETALTNRTQFHLVDVSDKTALEDCLRKIIEEWGDIDIIINNAGISQFSSITETSVEDFDNILSINLRPAFITSRRLALHRQSLDTPIHTVGLSTSALPVT